MVPKEYERSNLALELRAGKKRLESALRGLSDEQCEIAGVVSSGSVMDLLSQLVTHEFLALMEVSERLPSLPKKDFINSRRRTPAAATKNQIALTRSLENLLGEFGMLRSAIMRTVEQVGPATAKQNAAFGYVAEVCVARFNEDVEQIERWRSSLVVGFSAARLRAEARERELNEAIVDLSREDFLLGDVSLQALFSLSFDKYYSDEFVLSLGTELAEGKPSAFERMASVLEPVYTLLEMGMAVVDSFRVVTSSQDVDGNFISDWETVLGGTYSTGIPWRWRTLRVWKNRVVIAERIEDLAWPNA